MNKNMNFITSSTALLRHLQSISGVLSTSNTLPILDNFLFEIVDNQLTISASDLETTMRTSMEVEANGEGKIAIPAKLLLDVLKNLPDQPCTFSIDYATFGIEIAYDNGKSKMVGFNGDEFPKIPVIENSSSVRVSGEIISSAINKTLFATGNDDLRPVMSGVFCQFSPQDIIFVATDAHKLVRYRRTDLKTEGSSSLILPKKALSLLKSTLPSDETPVTVEFSSSNASFHFGPIKMVCRLIDERFPDYENVIPVDNPNRMNIDRLELLGSLRRIAIYANKTTHQVRLKLTGSELMISAEDLDFSNEANERLSCDHDGEDIEIGFNAKFLVEMLNNLSCKEVSLKFSAPNRAGLILPAEQDANEDILMLVMPVMLNNYV